MNHEMPAHLNPPTHVLACRCGDYLCIRFLFVHISSGRTKVFSRSCTLVQIVFLVKGPLYLVAISATEEPDQVIMGQLELLHAQVCLCSVLEVLFVDF